MAGWTPAEEVGVTSHLDVATCWGPAYASAGRPRSPDG
jgi:hypothetical protein